MTVDRWRRIEEVYQAAIALELSQRAAFVRNSCDGDEVLRVEVELFPGWAVDGVRVD